MVRRKSGKKVGDIPRWSWIAAGVGLALVLGSAGFMFYQGFTGDSSPPDLVIETGKVIPRGDRYLVPITVTNRGESAAAGLVLEGVLKAGGETIETSGITIDYVPSSSERKAGLFFSMDPRKFDLQVQARGFTQP